jgi:hypothetical protein
MKCLRDNDTIQIEITSFCPKNCANCTRFCHHYKKPWFMDLDTFKRAVDSMVGFKHMTGVMGGEPVLHPLFAEFCKYLNSKIPPEQTGLWTCFPGGKEHLGPIIADTFGNIFLNDHTRADILHCPFLVAIEEVVLDIGDMWYMIDHCWAQHSWSASINPLGAYFCEIAASMAALFDDPETAWPIESAWWARGTTEYVAQMKKWCPRCGGALHKGLKWKCSNEIKDAVSPRNLELLKTIDSPKVSREEYEVSDLIFAPGIEQRKDAAYKDEHYRQNIAARYGLFLCINQKGFLTPFQKIVGRKASAVQPDSKQ